MDAREMRGMEIAATVPLHRGPKGWVVPSQSGPGSYVVTPAPTTTRKVAMGTAPSPDGVQPWNCTCPDYELRGLPCKHISAVTFVIRRETINTDGSVVTEEIKVTYSQDWTAYNKAQTEEKDRFLPMLANLCSTIPQPPHVNGRPPMPLSDMAFAAVAKVYGGMSARRSDSDVRENAAKGHTETDPHFNTVLKYMRSPKLTPVLRNLVEVSAMPLKAVEDDFAADSTGFTTCRFARWYDEKWGKSGAKREWVKLHAMTGVLTNIVTAVEISGWRSNDTNYFRPLVSTTAENFDLGIVSADKAYLSRANVDHVEKFGGMPRIPLKSNSLAVRPGAPVRLPDIHASAWDRMGHLFAYHREDFLNQYHKRSNVETTFSMIKGKFGDSLRSKSDVGQINEVLCKVVCHNLCVLIASIHELGLDVPQFGAVA